MGITSFTEGDEGEPVDFVAESGLAISGASEPETVKTSRQRESGQRIRFPRSDSETLKRLLQKGQMASISTMESPNSTGEPAAGTAGSSSSYLIAEGGETLRSETVSHSSAAQPGRPHQSVGCLVSFLDPVRDLVGLRRILELDADRTVDPQGLDLLQVRSKVHDAAAGWEVAMYLAIAIADMNVDGLALEPPQLLRRRPGQAQVRHIDVRLHRRVV